MRERARDLGIVLDEHLVRDAERARTELDTLAQVVSANLTRAALEAAPVIADLSSWLADVAGKAGIAWERLFDAPENKSLRTLRYELDLTESTIVKLRGRIDELRKSPMLGFTTFIDTAQISALQSKIDELPRVLGQTQARIAFLEGPPEQPGSHGWCQGSGRAAAAHPRGSGEHPVQQLPGDGRLQVPGRGAQIRVHGHDHQRRPEPPQGGRQRVTRHGDLAFLAQADAVADPARRRRSKSALGLVHATSLPLCGSTPARALRSGTVA